MATAPSNATFDPSTLGLDMTQSELATVSDAVGQPTLLSGSAALKSHATLDFYPALTLDLDDPASWIGGGPDYHWRDY